MSSPTTAQQSESNASEKANVTQGEYGTVVAGHSSRAHPPERFSPLAIVGLAYSILNSWVAMAGSLSVVLPSGGPSAMLWGLIASTIGTFCITATMAEVAAVYVTPGGPYHHAYLLAPPRWKRSLSFIAGWWNTAGWWALTATASSIAGQYITGIISLLHPSYTLQRWHEFLVYVVWSIGGWAINVFGSMLLDPFNRFSIFWSMAGAFVICVVCLARASSGPSRYQSGDFVFRALVNRTGWPDGVAWLLGLLQSAFGLTASDGVLHIVEEMPRPHINAPRAMLLAVAIGSSSSFIVLVILLFVLNDLDAVIESGSGPLLQIIYQATRNRAAAVSLLMFPLISMCFAAIGILCAASRQTHTFAMDGGLPFSRFLSREASPKLGGVPWAALTLTTSLVIIFGCIYLGNSSALNAILSSSVVGLQISYAIPAAILLVRGRGVLDADLDETLATDPDVGAVLAEERKQRGKRRRPFDMGIFGYAINATAVAFCVVTIVFFLLPPELPVTAGNMNYTSAVIGVVIFAAALTWIINGDKFEGPVGLRETLLKLNAGAVVHRDEDDGVPSSKVTEKDGP
ncbi:hypothetical protein CF327_g6200 [Tilletia walkeri]|uniref:Choline transport protein n=1 Tax=Tilletia walkeri TaxID=117179 RepID=A0A8X7N743_9BASI|nr:hypothetical protein CF327_g6200 [Tilletia walkeri]KAE8266770.1 hypothetical protein A4X09_0g5575 [Tilletia walkeri]